MLTQMWKEEFDRFVDEGVMLDRWLKDETLGFPRPVVIRHRRYFKEAELLDWERAQASKSRAA